MVKISLTDEAHVLQTLITAQVALCKSEVTTINDPSLKVVNLARDLGTLLHSACTKLSLAARPPRTDEAISASFKEISGFLPAFGQLCAGLDPARHTQVLCERIRSLCKYALIGLSAFIAVITGEEDAQRLNKTAILWDSADELRQLTSADEVLSMKTEECQDMLSDAVTDLTEFLETDLHQDLDGLSLADETQETTKCSSAAQIDGYITKITRCHTLLRAIVKRRIDATTTVEMSNALFENISKLSIEVDDLACEIQDKSDHAYIEELGKGIVHRIEALLDATLPGANQSWIDWTQSFRKMWQLDSITSDPKK